ncbi:hypothetical protein [Sphaerisporangium fuscum]|uniref:hypothetical protein n=1 Tax=Sphaerisporangium fuscum TaxID=2835868 RepID=UPI001BDCBB5A|nr:hypothetical protein [Sphaerisporangium fuscum]
MEKRYAAMVVGTVTIVSSLLAAPVAQASSSGAASLAVSGGGCYKHSTNLRLPGWDIGDCISNRGTQTQVYPDMYINTVDRIPGNCLVVLYAIDRTIHRTARSQQFPCATGHYEIPHFNATPGHAYATQATVFGTDTNGDADSWGFDLSPELRF